jgi:hypothetical protein
VRSSGSRGFAASFHTSRRGAASLDREEERVHQSRSRSRVAVERCPGRRRKRGSLRTQSVNDELESAGANVLSTSPSIPTVSLTHDLAVDLRTTVSMAFKSALQLRSPPRHDVLAVDHLAGLLEGTGTLAQILDEISQPVWIPTATGIAKIDDQLPPSLDRSDLEGRLLLTVALQSRRPDALQCFCLLLWKGADPQARGRDDGRMVEWEFEEGHETFKRELNRAIEARRSAPPGRYRMRECQWRVAGHQADATLFQLLG